jgi:hypothetical protein
MIPVCKGEARWSIAAPITAPASPVSTTHPGNDGAMESLCGYPSTSKECAEAASDYLAALQDPTEGRVSTSLEPQTAGNDF